MFFVGTCHIQVQANLKLALGSVTGSIPGSALADFYLYHAEVSKMSMILPHLAVPEVQHSLASQKHFSTFKAKAKKTPDQVPAVSCNSIKSCCANTRLVMTAILVINHFLTFNLQNNLNIHS